MNRSPDLTTELHALLKERILILNGAMGTMIQRHKLEEEAYRGDRFSDWHCDLKGNNDLLSLTQSAIITGDPSGLSRSRGRYPGDQHLQCQSNLHGRL
jgi:hypothetical protein